MKIKVKVKQIGKKYPLLEGLEIEIDEIGEHPILRDFLCSVVKQQVKEFNKKAVGKNLLGYLSKEEISEGEIAGKVGFGRIYNDKKVKLKEAQETALLAFEDGLFSVFVGNQEIQKLDDIVDLGESKEVIFIRLTFLAGSYW